MKRDAVFQLRLSTPEAERLESQAADAGLSKADLIRKALGWDITGLTRSAAKPSPSSPRPKPLPAARKPSLGTRPGELGLAALRRRIAAGD